MSKGENVSELFPDVVKLVGNSNSEIKKMVYIYLIQYAEVEQNASLLAINILKKNISNSNQLIRAQALRTLSSFRVKMIIQVMMASITGGVKDSSSSSPKTSAHAIGKMFRYFLLFIFLFLFYFSFACSLIILFFYFYFFF